MARMVDAEQLVGAREIAQRLEVSRPQVVYEWRRRDLGFPEPVAVLSIGLIWDWGEVRRWAQASGRLRPGDRWFR